MSTCGHRGQHKGKRSCPALAGAICTRCCGRHRLAEIACPPTCVHLGGLAVVRGHAQEVPFTHADYLAAWEKLRTFALGAAKPTREVAERVADGASWDPSVAVAYVLHGHRGADGDRLIDRFVAARGRMVTAGEAAALVALQRARASLFEVEAVRVGVGVDLRDVLAGETLHVREVPGSARLRAGDALFAWVMAFPDHLELSGAAVTVERAQVERVRAALTAELAVARLRWPGVAEPDLVGSIAWVVYDVLDGTGDEDVESSAAEVTASSMADDDEQVPGWTYDPSRPPEPEAWLAADESEKHAAIEAHHRAWAIDLTNAKVHATLHAIVENQLAARSPRVAGETLERLVAAGVGRHQAVHAIGSVVAAALWDVLRHKVAVDHDAIAAALARLDPRDWRDGEPHPGARLTIPSSTRAR